MTLDEAYNEVKEVKDSGWNLFKEDFLTHLIGKDGFKELLDNELLELVRIHKGERFYTLLDKK
jgi:hypothetical protein